MLIQLDKVGASNHIENVVIPEDGVVNGALVQIGALGSYDSVNGVKIADITKSIVMLVEEFMNKTGTEQEIDMKFKAGDIKRGYHFISNDIITVTIDGVTGATNVSADMVGKFVIPVVGSYIGKVNATTAGSLCFEIVNVEQLDGKDALVLKVL